MTTSTPATSTVPALTRMVLRRCPTRYHTMKTSSPALAVEPATGNASMTRFWDKTITIIDNHQFVGDGYYPEWLRGKGGDWSNPMKHLQKVYESSVFDNVGYKMCYPIIICQKAVK